MASAPASLVDILREFLTAHEQLDQLAEKYKRDDLAFFDLQEFVGDSDNSVLFRLKEKCHSLFRPEEGGSKVARPREALFDLTTDPDEERDVAAQHPDVIRESRERIREWSQTMRDSARLTADSPAIF